MVIVALRTESEIKNVLGNTVWDLPVTNIKIKVEKDIFINEKKI